MAGSGTYIDDCDCNIWDTTSICFNSDLKVTNKEGAYVCGGNYSSRGYLF